ncbi:hypothetical protein [Dyella sp.]|uniref:hypothetical protein n=1 Tax=Dyella sp. TaxID=1869338 RepID=UPI002FDAED27
MASNLRMERIERILEELRYEITRGMMDGEIEETTVYQFVVPVSKELPGGVVLCQLRTRPMLAAQVHPDLFDPRLKVITGGRAS